MHWLWVILIGLVIGALAKLIMPGKDPGGVIVTILIGIGGSLMGHGSATRWDGIRKGSLPDSSCR